MTPSGSIPPRPRRTARRWAFASACLVTLIALFYAEENWRGRRAWEKCRRSLEAKGEALDWAAYVPAPAPDEQNVFKAPNIKEWFVSEMLRAAIFGKPGLSPVAFPVAQPTNRVTLAGVKIVPADAPLDPGAADAVLRLDDPASQERACELLQQALGPSAVGSRACLLLARPPGQVKPLRFIVPAARSPSLKELAQFLPARLQEGATRSASQSIELRLESAGTNEFHLGPKLVAWAAADYLAASDQSIPDLDRLRDALHRPLARMDGSYERPFATMPVVNFAAIRNAAQGLAQRAQCHLLLSQPEAAWKELALIHDLCRLTQARPVMLAAALVDVAVTGLYTGIVADGLRLHAWREPQLAAIERQLEETGLLPLLSEAFKTERAASRHTFETSDRFELAGLFTNDPDAKGLGGIVRSPVSLFMLVAPRGWLYQNIAAGADLSDKMTAVVDLSAGRVKPGEMENLKLLLRKGGRFSLSTFLTYRFLPNYIKAWQTGALNQTLVNEALVACALERYRLAQGQYPDQLDALLPRFVGKLPRDLVGGQSLRYHRANDQQFTLYSVGWNETDDGGKPGRTLADGDWVW